MTEFHHHQAAVDISREAVAYVTDNPAMHGRAKMCAMLTALRAKLDAADADKAALEADPVRDAATALREWADATDWEHANEFESFVRHLRRAIAGGEG